MYVFTFAHSIYIAAMRASHQGLTSGEEWSDLKTINLIVHSKEKG